ncbi:hypothetical protein KPH14_004779 [Odynerus spinipes]|uniref:Uncharacterized protein n=1 Tax=Odynerus spinipes TaxID=1348599 RepID=A0AAD9RNJ9_9HYME|nr:hypothetical protein KPH14_004779 [Odynerus spinipes]
MLKHVNDLLGVGAKPSRRSRNSEESSFVWQEYEFGTGAGNREEVVITNISINEEPKLPSAEFNWVFLSNNGTNYLACAKESTFMLYTSNTDDVVTESNFTEFKIDGQVVTFALINVEARKLHEENDIVAILCVEKGGANTLQWYRILGENLDLFWVWAIQEPIKDIKFLRYGDQNKLLLLGNKENYVDGQKSPVNIYGFSLDFLKKDYDFWLCQRILVPITFDMQICKIYEHALLALRGTNDVLLYEHVGRDYIHGQFEPSQTIKSNDLKNFICFESGYMQYLATSGPESALFNFFDNEFQYSSETEDFFNDFPEVAWVKDVRIETYRDESLLLVQLKNSTVFALAWEGEKFTKISLPNRLLDNFDLSKITSIPRYGFVSGNKFVRIETKLKELPRPIEDKVAGIIKTKAILEDILRKQESVIDQIDKRIDFIDRINHTDAGSLNISKIITTNLTTENTVYNSVSLGSNNLTYEDILTDISSIEESSNDLQQKYNKLESDLQKAFNFSTTDVDLIDFDISGNLNIKGNLYVEHFSADSINDLSMTDILENYVTRNDNTVINGQKSFSEVDAKNWIVRSINGIPMEKIIFGSSNVDHSNVNFSDIDNIVIDGDLTFSTINNISWDRLVWKNKLAFIPGKTVVDGEIKVNHAKVKNLNNLRYPHDYVLTESPIGVRVDGVKSFDRLIVEKLSGVQTINNISINEFITVDDDHILNNEITFHNITVLGSLKINGDVTGFDRTQLVEEPMINETSTISSDVIFLNLTVLGNVYLEDSIDNKNWSNFDDILSKNDSNVRIIGTKSFLGNVHIGSPFDLTSNVINGHDLGDFVTLDTDQVFSNLKEISADATFDNVTFGFTKKLEDFLKNNFAENSSCLDKTIIFEDTLLVDDLSFDTINNISSDLFLKKLNHAFKNVSFNNLTVDKLNVQEIIPEFINNIKYSEFVENAVTLSTLQNLTGNYTFDRIDTKMLQTEQLNGMLIEEWNDLIDHLHRFYHAIFNGNVTIDSVTVKGNIITPSINGILLEKMYNFKTMGNVIYQNDLYVEDLTVLGFVNDFNLTEVVENAVLKTDTDILVTGYKEFENVNCEFLDIELLNGHKLETLLDPYRDQNLTGSIIVNGTVNVLGTFDATGKINNISFRNLMNRVKKVDDDTFELNDNVQFTNDVEVIDLKTNGTIDGINFNEFAKSLVFKNEDNVTLIEPIIFLGLVTFEDSVIIEETLNGVNLKEFYKNAIFIDKPFTINSSTIFEEDIVVKKGLEITKNLEVTTIGDVDIGNLIDRIIYVDRPFYIDSPITFTNVTFDSGMQISHWNDVDMSLLIPLHTDQMISTRLIKASDITVGNIDIQGKVNDHELNTIYSDTFMKIGNQNITGGITFPGKVRMRRDFNPRLINGVSPKQIILVNSNDTITGNFEFKTPVILNGSLRILGRLNGIDPVSWEAVAVTTVSPLKQIVSGKWTVHGNVYLKKAVTGDGLLNGINSTALANMFGKNRMTIEAALTESEMNHATLCENTRNLQYYAENQIYKFDSFGYLQVLDSYQRILSVHHFELDDLDFLLISYDTCHVNVLQFTGTKFKLIASIANFGYVERWITLNHENVLYFVAIGERACKRSSINLWKLEDDEFVHVHGFDDVRDVKKLNNDTILLLFENHLEYLNIDQINNKSLGLNLYDVVKDQNLRFVPNTDRILLANRHSIYEYDKQFVNFTSSVKCIASNEIVGFKVGIFEREEFLHYDENTSKDYIFISDNNVVRRKILQTIRTHNPASFSIINFEGLVETLLIFVENNRSLQVYEYKGIEGFVHRDTIKMKAEKVFKLKIRKYSNMAKRHCLAVIQDNRLTILEAKMYGEKLDMPKLSCTAS